MKQAKLHKEGSYLFGSDCQDINWTDVLSFELKFIQNHNDNFFSTKADLMTVCNQIATKVIGNTYPR